MSFNNIRSSRHKKDRKRDKEHRDKDKKKRRHSGSRSGSEEKSKKEVNIEKKKDEEVVEKKPTEENGSSVIVPAEKAIKNVETITNGQTSPVETWWTTLYKSKLSSNVCISIGFT